MAELPVDLVEEILLRLDDAADLVRASAACAAFRRVVSDIRFLRRFVRSLRRPPVVGLLSRRSNAGAGFRFNPAAPPRRTAQAARAVARAVGLSSPLLPAEPTTEHCLCFHDARDGRVLLSPGDANTCLTRFSYLVVYDPLHGKHVQVPPIPADIIVACTCSLQQASSCECEFAIDPFFVPATDDDEDDSSFRVMCTVFSTSTEDDYVLEAFVYSSVTAKWCRVASISEADYEPLFDLVLFSSRDYAQGCFYWVRYYCEEEMLVLDMNEMKFSAVCLPPGTKHKPKAVVKAAAAQDRIGLLVLCYDNNEQKLDLYTKALGASDAANDCWQWRHDAVIPLLDSYQWFFGGAADLGYALLLGIPRDEYLGWRIITFEEGRPKTNAHYFTVDLRTLLVEQLCVVEFDNEPYHDLFLSASIFPPPAFLYASFPPPFALPSI